MLIFIIIACISPPVAMRRHLHECYLVLLISFCFVISTRPSYHWQLSESAGLQLLAKFVFLNMCICIVVNGWHELFEVS